jgi:uncharacterized membrane protein YfcA
MRRAADAPLMSFELILIVAVVAGLVGAMSGMGGGVVLIPALTFFGMDIKRAIAVSIVSVIATSSLASRAGPTSARHPRQPTMTGGMLRLTG